MAIRNSCSVPGVLKLHEELTITTMGAKGDGVARHEGRAIHVPYTLAGERIVATVDGERGELNDVLLPSPDRIAPICRYFGTCGGCALQHWAPEPYAMWKRGLLGHALLQQGIETVIKPLIDAHRTGRRRAVFHARKKDGRAEAGFMARGTHDLIAIERCPILVPALAGAPALATRLAQIIDTDKPLDIHMTATESGIDCDIRGLGVPSDRQRRRLVENFAGFDLARLSVHGALIAIRNEPVLRIGRANVVLPSGAFLQATAEGEAALTSIAAEMVGNAKKIADLFCGIGPFSLRLAEKASVTAFDSDESAVAALRSARAEGLKPIKASVRDLFRVPLVPAELNGYDAVLLDPPRAGARAQMAELARSDVPRVISVSCDVQSFARDAKILIEAGYVCERVVPVDQFAYSAHLEMVGLFTKTVAPARKRRLLG
jgi:23S rRNA (uracil1939-C5)-methyltransferase